MKKFFVILCATIITVGLFAFNSYAVSLSGTLNVDSSDDYDYLLSPISMDFSPGGWVSGSIDLSSLNGAGNNIWVEVGLITKDQIDRALTTYGVDSYMFNQAAFMMSFSPSAGSFAAQSSDYAGDFPGGVGTAHYDSDGIFDFSLYLDGSLAYLSTDGGPYDATGLAYGTDNWNNYGWSFPTEDFTDVSLIGQLYTSNGTSGTVIFEASAAPIPEPGTMILFGSGLIGLVGFRRKFKKA